MERCQYRNSFQAAHGRVAHLLVEVLQLLSITGFLKDIVERVSGGHNVGGRWVDEGCRQLLGLTRSQALEDKLAAGVSDELQLAKVDNPAWVEGFDEPEMAR